MGLNPLVCAPYKEALVSLRYNDVGFIIKHLEQYHKWYNATLKQTERWNYKMKI